MSYIKVKDEQRIYYTPQKNRNNQPPFFDKCSIDESVISRPHIVLEKLILVSLGSFYVSIATCLLFGHL